MKIGFKNRSSLKKGWEIQMWGFADLQGGFEFLMRAMDHVLPLSASNPGQKSSHKKLALKSQKFWLEILR